MRVSVDDDGSIILTEIYNPIGLETAEGNFMSICMRDDTFEFKVFNSEGVCMGYRIDMEDGTVNRYG